MVYEIFNNLVCLCSLGYIVECVIPKNNTEMGWKWHIPFMDLSVLKAHHFRWLLIFT